jgi:hypothetical protein
MGVTGAGKTSFIQHFTRQKLAVGEGLESCKLRVLGQSNHRANIVNRYHPGWDTRMLPAQWPETVPRGHARVR